MKKRPYTENELVYSMLSDLQNAMNSLSVILGQLQSTADKNSEEFEKLKQNLENYIYRINEIPLENKKKIKELQDELNKLKEDIELLKNQLMSEVEKLDVFKKESLQNISLMQNKIENIYQYFEACKVRDSNFSKFKSKFLDIFWKFLTPILITLLGGVIYYLISFLIELLVIIRDKISIFNIK